MRPRDVRKLMGITSRTLNDHVRNKEIKYHRSAAGRKTYDEAEIKAFMASHARYHGRLRAAEQYEAEKYQDRFTTTQAATILRVSSKTVRRWSQGLAEQADWLELTRTQIELIAKKNGIIPRWPSDDQIILTIGQAAEYLGLPKTRLRLLEQGVATEYGETGLVNEAPDGLRRHMYSKKQLREFALANPKMCPFFRDKEGAL